MQTVAVAGMKEELYATVQNLMDSGYTMDEASKECMNKFRKDSDMHTMMNLFYPTVLKVPQDYMESCGSTHESC